MKEESLSYSLLKLAYSHLLRLWADVTWTQVGMTVLVLVVFSFRKRTSKGLKNLKVSLPEERHWFFGHAKFLGRNFLKEFRRICVDSADEYGLSSFFLFNKLVVSVTRADHAQVVLMASSYRERLPIIGRHFDKVLGPKSLVLLMGEEWKFHRRIIGKAFSYQHLKQMVNDMNIMGDRFTEALLMKCDDCSDNISENIVDFAVACKAVTLDIIGITVFGHDFGSSTSLDIINPIASSFDFLVSDLTRRQFHNPLSIESIFYFLPFENNRKYKKARETIDNELHEIVTRKRKDLRCIDTNSETKQHQDILRFILESYLEENIDVSSEFIRDNLVTLLFAGYDTTSIALCYLFYSLARNPHVEDRALSEINSILLPNQAPSYEQLTKEFVYCTAVVEEVLRLYPPAPLTVRDLEKNVTLTRTNEKTWGHPDREPVIIPAGTTVYLPIWWIQRSNLNFVDPGTFCPERFLPENKKHLSRCANMAFSGGSRDCIGRRFAMLELLSLFVNIVRKLKIELVEGYVLESEVAGPVQRPQGGIPFVVKKRQQ